MPSLKSAAIVFLTAASLVSSAALPNRDSDEQQQQQQQCRRTQVAILGAGTAGITTAWALHNASVDDFIIVDRNDYIGGRMAHTTFGSNPETGEPYVVELGANWVQGLGSPGGPENPIWTFAKQYNLTNEYSDYDSILSYDQDGYNNYTNLITDFDDAWSIAEQDAGYILTENLQDYDVRTGFELAGWKPKANTGIKQAVEWWMWDWETSYPLQQSGFEFGITGYNLTFYQWSDENNFVTDQRGFNFWLRGTASRFLKPSDPRLLLSTTVETVSYSDSEVTLHMDDGSCIQADYAVCTASLGVLQQDVIKFEPELPRWKKIPLNQFQMGTYTKIFFQFPHTFWPTDTQFFLYADPVVRGYYPVWQSLDNPDFLPGSHILFVTVVYDESYRVEAQSAEQTKREAMEVLQKMFPNETIPEPTDFMYPRWSLEPWAHGSYSNWPVGMTLERHQDLRANVDRLWFAGEHTSAQYYGFLHGAWFEGQDAGERIAGLLGKGCVHAANDEDEAGACGEQVRYEELYGTTPLQQYGVANGWDESSFLTYGF